MASRAKEKITVVLSSYSPVLADYLPEWLLVGPMFQMVGFVVSHNASDDSILAYERL